MEKIVNLYFFQLKTAKQECGAVAVADSFDTFVEKFGGSLKTIAPEGFTSFEVHCVPNIDAPDDATQAALRDVPDGNEYKAALVELVDVIMSVRQDAAEKGQLSVANRIINKCIEEVAREFAGGVRVERNVGTEAAHT